MNRLIESSVGIVWPAPASESNAHAPPAFVRVESCFEYLLEYQ
jgi:hypothetical protein